VVKEVIEQLNRFIEGLPNKRDIIEVRVDRRTYAMLESEALADMHRKGDKADIVMARIYGSILKYMTDDGDIDITIVQKDGYEDIGSWAVVRRSTELQDRNRMTPAIKKAKLYRPVEELVYVDMFRRVARYVPHMHSDRKKEEMERLKHDMFRFLIEDIYLNAPMMFPNIPFEELVLGMLEISERDMYDKTEEPMPEIFSYMMDEKQIEATIKVYRKVTVEEVWIEV
jgi:hypothetical protein